MKTISYCVVKNEDKDEKNRKKVPVRQPIPRSDVLIPHPSERMNLKQRK